jgi:L-rhamnose mutarotase
VERVCFLARIHPELIDEYRERHQAVWPEMQEALRATGWGNYSLFLADDGTLIGYLETPDYAKAQQDMAATEVNARWQAEMGKYFAAIGDLRPDESFIRIPEAFHLD